MATDSYKDIAKLEADLWEAADNLRANSKLTSSDYFMPVLGVIFLRHAANRFDVAQRQIVEDQASGKMPRRPVRPADYIARRSLYLPEQARYEWIMQQAAVSGSDLPALVTAAMTAIEAEFEPLLGVLPKDYGIFDSKVLEDLLRTFNSEQIRQATGDVFGRIYEYFLAKFSMQKAHDNGEFFTPSSIVQMIVNVIEPDHGVVCDLACGSGGMFVQSSHFIEHEGLDTARRVTFYGQEKNRDTIRIAKMNLAVHGLDGKIAEAISYYQDEHNLHGQCDFVMANPPFNVDLVDAERIKSDPRLPFGLPGVNKDKKVSNGNYLWISYFWSYLNEHGRAGFVMSSQASSAGHGERDVRRKIVETGDVDVMISIRSNFFYTRTVPCELWFFDRAKRADNHDKVLMLDARNVYRKVTRKIYDFAPEQLSNLSAIVWLYRSQPDRYLKLIAEYLRSVCAESADIAKQLAPFDDALQTIRARLSAANAEARLRAIDPAQAESGAVEASAARDALIEARLRANALSNALAELDTAAAHYTADRDALLAQLTIFFDHYAHTPSDNPNQHAARLAYNPIAEASRGLIKQIDLLHKLAARAADAAVELDAALPPGAGRGEGALDRRTATRLTKQLDEARKTAVAQLKHAVYFHRQISWLHERFPDAELVAVPGLVKLVSRQKIAAADYSLTPGRYVGVAPAEVDEDFDFEQTLRDIHTELGDLNREAAELASRIQANLVELGV